MFDVKKFLLHTQTGLLVLPLALIANGAMAQYANDDATDDSEGRIEEIVVTSEKRESTAQDTALALSAFDQNALERENIDNTLDLQFTVPNLIFSKGNFYSSNIAIRGIGNNAVASSSDSGTGVHFNGFYLVAHNLFETSFLDVDRVEVLRGPQGTLYGRNTTAGVMNLVPAKATDTFQASGEMEFGDYDSLTYKSVVNLPLTSWLQIRTSLYRKQRDGLVLNQSTGNTVDDRDIVAGRFAVHLGAADSPFELNIFYNHLLEEDSRLRSSKQFCHTDTKPYPYSLGCLPGQSLYEGDRFGAPTSYATLPGFLAAYYPGAAGPDFAGLGFYSFATPPESHNPDDVRTINAVIDPYYKVRDRIGTLDMRWSIGQLELNLITGRQLRGFSSNADYNGSTGVDGIPEPFDLTAVATWNAILASQIPDPNTAAYVAGYKTAEGIPLLFSADPVFTGHGQSTNDHQGLFGWDWSYSQSENESTEFRLQSEFEGGFNFMVGLFSLEYESESWYDVHANILSALAKAPDLGYYRNHTKSYALTSDAFFAELYFKINKVNFTFGLRSTEENKDVEDRQTLLNDPELPYIAGITGLSCLNDPTNPFKGWTSSGACENNAVPEYDMRGNSWNEDTWKFGVDFYVAPGSLVYITSARSYKSGGLNPPSFSGAFPAEFGPEYVNSFEFGIKNSIGGRANINLTAFYYDYEGLQISKIVDRTSVNENVDAVNQGLELEIAWAPSQNWRFDLNAAKLDTEIQGGASINPADPANAYTDGNSADATFINAKNVDASVLLVLNPEAATPYSWNPADCGTLTVDGGVLQCSSLFTQSIAATFNADCVTAVDVATCDGAGTLTWLASLSTDTLHGADGLVAGLDATAFSQVPIGISVDLTGNKLPGAPESSVRLGAQYNIDLDGTTLTLRGDYYWQSDFYYRVFNTQQDLIESWRVFNFRAVLSSKSGDWSMELWIKNVEDEDHVTGAYFTDASSGNFTNVFLLEPRTSGVSFKLRY